MIRSRERGRPAPGARELRATLRAPDGFRGADAVAPPLPLPQEKIVVWLLFRMELMDEELLAVLDLLPLADTVCRTRLRIERLLCSEGLTYGEVREAVFSGGARLLRITGFMRGSLEVLKAAVIEHELRQWEVMTGRSRGY